MDRTWKSFRLIQRLYRQHTIRRLVELFVSISGGGILCFHILFFGTELLSLGGTGINVLFIIVTGVLILLTVQSLRRWFAEGIRLSAFFHQWERNQPSVANRTSLMVYAGKNPKEIERLGYSHELIQADDVWLNDYIEQSLNREKNTISIPLFILLGALAIPSTIYWTVQRDYVAERTSSIVHALSVRDTAVQTLTLEVAETLAVERGRPITLYASLSEPLPGEEGTIHFSTRSGWQSRKGVIRGKAVMYKFPSVNQPIDYYFSAKSTLSNRGKLTPLDPPSLLNGTIAVKPPEHTDLPAEKIDTLRPITIPRGSRAAIQAVASSPLKEASFVYGESETKLQPSGSSLGAAFYAMKSGPFSFRMTGQRGLSAQSTSYLLTVVPDATPTIEILHPPAEVDIPSNLVQKVQLHAHDDYRIQRVNACLLLNGEPPANPTIQLWAYSPQEAKKIHSATDFFVTFDWDLADFGLYPGDELEYTVEVWDNDAIDGPKSGRSKTHVIHYPTLVELLSRLNEKEEEQIDKLNDLVRDQKEITEDAKKTIDKIAEKIENREYQEEGKESTWTEENELKEIKKRQEELAEEAKQLEEEIAQYREQAEEAASNENIDDQGFTPETLEKMERIDELLKELIDKDSQELLQQIENTIEKLSQDLTEQDLKELEFSFEDFNEQLDRTLSQLEETYTERQLEGLQQMAEDIAERQDHLQRETEKLAEEKEELSQSSETDGQEGDESDEQSDRQEQRRNELDAKENLTAQRQQKLEEETQDLLNKMKELEESLQGKNPELAQQLNKMKQETDDNRLQQELADATKQLEQQQTRQAQSHQQNALQQLQSLSKQMEQSMATLSGMQLTMDTEAIAQLIQKGLFLSHRMEELTESTLGQSDALEALRRAQTFRREQGRMDVEWKKIAKLNPFLKRSAEDLLRRSAERLQYAIDAGQGIKWVGLHETRQSIKALNAALLQMLDDMTDMQQQMAQSQSQTQSLQQQMQQLISRQQSLQQMLDEMRQMKDGQGQGKEMMKRLRDMARQQAAIRKEFEKMMQQYRHAQQMRNRLEGIYQEMKEAGKLLEEGHNDGEVEEKQKRILTRMLEAGTMQEEDNYGNEREEEVAKTGLDPEPPQPSGPVTLPEKIRQAIQRPDIETIPLPYREAIKNHYIRLSEQAAQ